MRNFAVVFLIFKSTQMLFKLRRKEVLTHYSHFKDLARQKRDRLEEARQFQYFKRDADELEIWILEKLQTAAEESYKDPTNLQACSTLLWL